MANSRRYLKSKGTASPAPKPPSTGPSQQPAPISEEGLLSFAELAIGALVIAFLLVVAVNTLRITEKGTVNQKKQQQALDLAKEKAEELKSFMAGQSWINQKVDVRFPPAQTPMVSSYNSYPPTTITMGSNTFILDPEVRYVQNNSTSQLVYIDTPGTTATPEVGDLIRIRVDCYYGPPAGFIPYPTVEAGGLSTQNRMMYTNLIANRTINVGAPSQVWGYVNAPCFGSPPNTTVQVGLYQGAQEISRALTDSTGYYSFNNVVAGSYSIQIDTAAGYQSQGPCNFTNPIAVTAGTNVVNQQLGVTLIPVWNYWGYVVQTTPGWVASAATPSPVVPTSGGVFFGTATPVPIPNAIVFSDDGNSSPTTTNASGAYTITQVRATPVAGHAFDTIEGDDNPLTLMGRNYNLGPNTYLPNGNLYGSPLIGPITIYVTSPIANTIPVNFLVTDEQGNNFSGNYYPITLTVVDGSAVPPSTTMLNPTNTCSLNVHPGGPNVSLAFRNNSSPPSWAAFNQNMTIDATTAQPITLVNYAIGSMSGTVAGMGQSFDYSQFNVMATDDTGQFLYSIPVSCNFGATFGTFSYPYLRTPMADSGDLVYNFTANGLSDYTSTTETQDAKQGTYHTLNNPILVSLLNVYAAVTVTQKGQAYPYGAWVSAQMVPSGSTPPSAPPTTGMGYGFTVSNYFSTLTKGDGTGLIQCQLDKGGATTYVFSAEIVDPTTFAVSNQSQTITVPTTATFASPQGVSFGF